MLETLQGVVDDPAELRMQRWFPVTGIGDGIGQVIFSSQLYELLFQERSNLQTGGQLHTFPGQGRSPSAFTVNTIE